MATATVNHLQRVSSLMKEMYSIKLDRHCLICLKEEDPSVIRNLVSSNPKGIESFLPLMCYVRGTRHEDETGSGTMIKAKLIPPLCNQCYDLASELFVLHRELLDVQFKIQAKVELVRNVIKGTREGETSRKLRIGEVSAANGFHEKLCNQIIDAGGRIYFPMECCPKVNSLSGRQEDFQLGATIMKEELSQESDDEMDTEYHMGNDLDEDSSYSVSFDDLTEDDDNEGQMTETTTIVQSESRGQKILLRVNQPEPSRPRKPKCKPAPAHVSTTTPISNCPVPVKVPRLSSSTDYTLSNTDKVFASHSVSQHAKKPVLLKVTQGGTSSFIKVEVSDKSNEPPATLKPLRPKRPESLNIQKCDICGDKYPVGPLLHEHLKSHVGPDYVFSCNICNHAFVSSFRFNTFHLKTESCSNYLQVNEIIHECPMCPLKTTNTRIFRNHFQQHEVTALEKPFSCPLCSAKYACKKSVEIHLEGKHLCHSTWESQKCEVCDTSKLITDMKEHLELVHHVFNSLKCKLCNARYVSVEKMVVHQLHHRKRTKIMACHLCDERYTILRDFQIHYLTVHDIGKKYNCEKCKWECYSELTLKRHEKKCFQRELRSGLNRSSPTSNTRYSCPEPECDLSFSKQDFVLQHRIKEHGHPPIECPYTTCYKTFTNRLALRKHTASTHGGISFCKEIQSCEECGEGNFKSDKELEQHKLAKHSTETPFVCEACGKAFRLKSALHTHTKVVHLKTKKIAPHPKVVCETCGKRVFHIQQHMLTHTKERPFTCEVCGQNFRQKVAWRTHVKSHERLGDNFKPKGPMERGVRKR